MSARIGGGVSIDDMVALSSLPSILDVRIHGGRVDGGGLAGGVNTPSSLVDDAAPELRVPANGRLGAQKDDSRVPGNFEAIVCSDASLKGPAAGGWAIYGGGTLEGGGDKGGAFCAVCAFCACVVCAICAACAACAAAA